MEYSKEIQDNPQRVFETQSAREIIEPVLARYIREEQRILEAMDTKKLTDEEYRTLLTGIEVIRKQIQLLGGKPTEIIEEVPRELEDIYKEFLTKANEKI